MELKDPVRLLLCVLLLLSACDELANAISQVDAYQDPCAGAPAEIQGTWTLHGQGARRDCEDRKLLSDSFSLQSVDLTIVQQGDAFGLGAGTGIPGVRFAIEDASVNGICVRFRTLEGEGGDEIVYAFDGRVSGFGRIDGAFSGTGPGSCTSAGSFNATIR